MRNILHLDLDTFFVSVERLRDSSLMGKPVIVGGTSGRSVVSGCSYEARCFGVHSGMSIKFARRLCSDAAFIRGDLEQYSYYSRMIGDIIQESAPLYEKASIDEFYLDISGMDRFFGLMKWSHELRNRIISESGLPISFGLSANKTVSKIATGEAKPNGELQIADQQIQDFLAPLPIRKIPMLGKKSDQLLRSMGVFNIGTLRQIPLPLLENAMGLNGRMIWEKANGIDNDPVIPYEESKSISTESTFENDISDPHLMERLLLSMSEKLAFRLRKKDKLCGGITLKIRYADYDTHSMQKRIPYTAFDHEILDTARMLFKKLYSRRLRVRLIGLRLSELIGGNQQLHLFDDTEELGRLYQSMDYVRKRFGEKAITHAAGMAVYKELKNEKT
ncbi:MAG: DNA polymerase IV [Bacteroidales bacterium]|nr:DNA polymerase IV [Bacteroidales bacterium]